MRNYSLFERQKNRIVLNETGKLAAEYARRVLEDEMEMERSVRAFDRSIHTVSVGSCCPGPLMDLLPKVTGLFHNMAVSSSIDTQENLLEGLRDCRYTFIILPNPVDLEGLFCKKYREEQLFLSVTPFHPAASCKEISFAEVNGQSFIMYAHVGFWEDIVRSRMPESRFFLQEDFDAVGELAHYSELPHFASDITLNAMPSRRNGRINVPFSDPESHVWYYMICLEQNKERLNALFQLF